jgi:hypothetical protein
MSKVQTDWKIKPVQVKSVEDIKKVFLSQKGRDNPPSTLNYKPLEFRLLLRGKLFSRKIIIYYPMRTGKPQWDVYHSISESWEACTDESLEGCLHGKDGALFNFWFIPDNTYEKKEEGKK